MARPIELSGTPDGNRSCTARLGPIVAVGATDGEALQVLAVLLRATASECEAMAAAASERAALHGASGLSAGLSAGLVG